MSRCECYRKIDEFEGRCMGTKECDKCDCEGEESKCDFYPFKRLEGEKKRQPDLVESLKNEIMRRDNMLAEMGIHLTPDEPTRWEYKTRGEYRKVTSDGWVICPKCRTAFVRLIGQWYKHCPECGKRMGTKEVAE